MPKATRDGFGDGLLEAYHENLIVLGADLNKATKADKFCSAYPDKYFECGIAENNMIGIASGLADQGYKVFISSFASFLAGKYDTIRCSLAYSKAPVVLVGSHVGMAIGKDGVTQMGLEDVSLMRALPGMAIFNPATYNEAKSMTKWLATQDILAYLRVGRQPVEEIFPDDYEFSFAPQVVYQGNLMTTIFTTGCMTSIVIEAAKKSKTNPRVIHVPVLKPIETCVIYNKLENVKRVLTIEDHNIIGGLGSLVCESICDGPHKPKVERIGLTDFPESGSPDDLYKKYGLDIDSLVKKIDDQ